MDFFPDASNKSLLSTFRDSGKMKRWNRICNDMKKLILLFSLALLIWAKNGMAQESSHALGLRFGGGDGFGTEISYQYGLSQDNRLEFDLGLKSHDDYDIWALVGLYEWVWEIDQGLNWYAGPGGKIGSWSWDSDYPGGSDSEFFIAAAGVVGIEYLFDFGLQLSLDFRPELGLVNHGNDFDLEFGFSARYRF